MPKALERKLMAEAHRRGYSKTRAGAYVYGTLRKTGWKPSRERKVDREQHGGYGKETAAALMKRRHGG